MGCGFQKEICSAVEVKTELGSRRKRDGIIDGPGDIMEIWNTCGYKLHFLTDNNSRSQTTEAIFDLWARLI